MLTTSLAAMDVVPTPSAKNVFRKGAAVRRYRQEGQAKAARKRAPALLERLQNHAFEAVATASKVRQAVGGEKGEPKLTSIRKELLSAVAILGGPATDAPELRAELQALKRQNEELEKRVGVRL